MIGVCIKYFHENYGGMLQAYATVSMLESRGLDYELIQYQRKKTLPEMVRMLPRLLNGVLWNDKYEALRKKIGYIMHPEFAKNDVIRKEEFRKFKEKHFTRISPVYIGYKELCKGAENYTAVVTGSDQLWSPAGLPTNYYNLMFVGDKIRKISYASSFGVRNIPWYQKKRTAYFLKRIDYISMRENRGSEIVKELINRDVPTVLDPVFMFDKEGWERLVPKKEEIKEKYIFAYFLGDNREYRRVVESAAKELKCKIIALRHLDQYVPSDEQFGDIGIYDVGPDRFLNLLRSASYICTDSFHGSCFSIIHNKKFITFNRYQEKNRFSKNSRIDTLCNNLGLNERRYNSSHSLGEQLNEEIDYNLVHGKLKELKKETDTYLEKAFGEIL